MYADREFSMKFKSIWSVSVVRVFVAAIQIYFLCHCTHVSFFYAKEEEENHSKNFILNAKQHTHRYRKFFNVVVRIESNTLDVCVSLPTINDTQMEQPCLSNIGNGIKEGKKHYYAHTNKPESWIEVTPRSIHQFTFLMDLMYSIKNICMPTFCMLDVGVSYNNNCV